MFHSFRRDFWKALKCFEKYISLYFVKPTHLLVNSVVMKEACSCGRTVNWWSESAVFCAAHLGSSTATLVWCDRIFMWTRRHRRACRWHGWMQKRVVSWRDHWRRERQELVRRGNLSDTSGGLKSHVCHGDMKARGWVYTRSCDKCSCNCNCAVMLLLPVVVAVLLLITEAVSEGLSSWYWQ